MFYALVASLAALLLLIVSVAAAARRPHALALVLLVAYFAAAWMVLDNFRRIRVKEIEAIFAATFKNGSCFRVTWT